MSENSQLPLRRVLWVVLSGLIIFAYSNTMRAPFVYDDKLEVIGNTTPASLISGKALSSTIHPDGCFS